MPPSACRSARRSSRRAAGVTCWPSTMSGLGKRSSAPSAIIACDPAPYSSAGWKTATIVPDHSSFVCEQALEGAEQAGDVHVVAARVHDGHVGARRVGAARGARVRAGRSAPSPGSASMSARSQTTGPSPFADRRRSRRSCRCPLRTRCPARRGAARRRRPSASPGTTVRDAGAGRCRGLRGRGSCGRA